MHFDALATACMAAELQTRLCPGRVQQVLVVDANSIGLEVYAQGERHQLLLCVQPGRARLHLAAQKLRRGVEQETPLLLLLRKYVRDATLTAVRQPDPFDRVLHLEVEHRETGRAAIVVELLGRQSNLFLVNAAGRILAGLHQVQAAGAGQRSLTPSSLYTPPVQARLSPLDDGRADYYERLAGLLNHPGKLAKALGDGLAGVSPSAARELAWRTTGDADAPASAANVLAVAAALQALWAPLETNVWQPGLAWTPGQVQPGQTTGPDQAGEQITGFFAYHAHTYGAFTPTASLSEAVAAWAAAAPEPAPGGSSSGVTVDPYAGQRGNVRAELRRAAQQVQRRLAALAADEPAPGEADRTRQAAEWLLALASQVQPGQAELVVPLDEETLIIPLDSRRGPVAQAEGLFKRAAKLARAAVFIPQRRAQLEQDLALLDQLGYDLAQATNQPEIAAVRAELRAAGLGPKEGAGSDRGRRSAELGKAMPSAGKAGQPLRFRSPSGIEIVVGRNARQNEHVTFAVAHPGDWWLHVRGQPGAHVVVKGAGREPDAATLQAAAQLAAYYSSARGERAADVILAHKRDVSRAPGGKVGQVMVAKEKVMAVPAELPSSVTAIK